MNKLIILLSFFVCFSAAGRLNMGRKVWWLPYFRAQNEEPTKLDPEPITEHWKQMHQLFILEVLQQVHKPLINQKLIELGKVLIMDPALYWEPTDELLLEFLEKCRQHEVLGRDHIFSDLNMEYAHQLVGLTKFLTLAKDWSTFERNVCFARLHINPVIFVNALMRAINERTDTYDIVVPSMNEILPHLFYDKNVIIAAENVDWNDLLNETAAISTKPGPLNILRWNRVMPSRNWISRRWQPLNVQMPTSTKLPLIEPKYSEDIEIKADHDHLMASSDLKIVIPVEQNSPLSYFMNDIGLNAFWNEAINERLIQTITSVQGQNNNEVKKWASNDQNEERRGMWSPQLKEEKENVVILQSREEESYKHREKQNDDVTIGRGNQLETTGKMYGEERFYDRIGSNIGTGRLLHVGRRRQKVNDVVGEPATTELRSMREPVLMVRQRMKTLKVEEQTKQERNEPTVMNRRNPERPLIEENRWTEDEINLMNENHGWVDRNTNMVNQETETKHKADAHQSTWENIVDGDRIVSRRRVEDDEHEPTERMARSIKTAQITQTEELMRKRSGEVFIQNLQQLMARINMERLSLGVEESVSLEAAQLLTTNSVQYQQRVVTQNVARQKIKQSIQQLEQIIDRALAHAHIELNNPDILRMIGRILIENNGELANVWDELYTQINDFIYGQSVNAELKQKATLLSIASGNLREPIYLDIVEGLNKLINKYMMNLQPYTRAQLTAPGIVLKSIDVDQLVTYFDITDTDLINLIDQQLLQSNTNNILRLHKQLVARQKRLNHKQFTLGYDILSERNQRVVVRTFIGPKQSTQSHQFDEIRQSFILIDAFVKNLEPGLNRIERNSRDITWTTRDTSTLSEIYRTVMRGMPVQDLIKSNCRFPHRLLIPRGTTNGLAFQLFVIVTPVTEEDRRLERAINHERICGLGIAGMSLDTLPLNYPLDRKIENPIEFLQDNMIFKDVMIMHDDRIEMAGV